MEFISRPGVRIEEQQGFIRNGLPILVELDDYIKSCTAVIHLAGDRTGAGQDDGIPGEANLNGLRARYPDLLERLRLKESDLREISYTQWEALLAIYHQPARHIRLYVANPDPKFQITPDTFLDDTEIRQRQRSSQERHLQRLQSLDCWPAFHFQSVHHLCLVIESSTIFSPGQKSPLTPTIPYSIGKLFKGREAWMAKIHEAIRAGRGDDSVRIVVHGIGGLGKTRLAAEYAYACAHEHTALLMVSGETAESLKTGLSDLCGALNLPQAASDHEETRIKATWDWLNAHQNRGWLLIVDNVDYRDVFFTLLDTITKLRRGNIVLTSRFDRWPQGFVDLQLDLLDSTAAIDYLLEATTGGRISLEEENGEGTDRAFAETICTKLGRLTLGLVQPPELSIP